MRQFSYFTINAIYYIARMSKFDWQETRAIYDKLSYDQTADEESMTEQILAGVKCYFETCKLVGIPYRHTITYNNLRTQSFAENVQKRIEESLNGYFTSSIEVKPNLAVITVEAR